MTTEHKKKRGTIFLHASIWESIAQIAFVDGVDPAEELRGCVLDGLRLRQKRLVDAGVSVPEGISYDVEDPAIALLRSLVSGEKPSASEVAAVAKALDVSPHELQAKLEREGSDHAVSVK